MASYEEALHLLRYRNWNARSLLDRKFKLVCSELSGRYVSNEFQVEVGAGSPWRGPRVAPLLAEAGAWSSGGGSSWLCPRGAPLSSPKPALVSRAGAGQVRRSSARELGLGGSWLSQSGRSESVPWAGSGAGCVGLTA